MVDHTLATTVEAPPVAGSGPAVASRPTYAARRGTDRAGALVIGGDYRGLGIVRSLGRQGIPVWVLRDEHAVASTSRYCRRSLPWPALDESQQVEYLLRLGAKHRLDGWALYPTGDESAALIARHHEVLSERFRLTTPPWEVMRWAYDKRLSYRLAAEVGVDHPWTRRIGSREEIATLDCVFPVILKPAHKERELNSLTTDKAWRVEDRQELLDRYDEACELMTPDVVIVQELIPGGGETQLSYVALCEEGRVLVQAAARRARQYPVDFGRASTYVEIVDLPELEEPARRLLAAMRYTGMIEVEFKRDPRCGSYKLLDINPRAWGWHTLCQRAGIDFPYLQWRMLYGEPVHGVRARSGVRWVRMAMDLRAAVAEIRQGRLSPRAYLRSLWGQPLEFAIFAADDPLPALVDLPLLVYLSMKRGAA